MSLRQTRSVACLTFLFAAVSLGAPSLLAGVEELATDDLRLVYLDPVQTYITPHAARCFENSMRFQRELWDYEPSEPVTVLLTDFSDIGNASAGNVPRNSLIVDTAPLSLAYETVTPNERMNWIMNHELVHIATGDRAAKSDRRFRSLFRGKVAPEPNHPESILYFYLTTPRYAVPQWYREGIAVFVETWMAGGLGRAQGPWDEMVFRSMVCDETPFYDPLGLVSEGVQTDFQAGVNNYLYGTRFISYLAYAYSPQEVVDWVSRRDGSKRYYARQFRAVFGKPLAAAWQDWTAWEREFQQVNLDSIRAYPLTPYVDLSDRAFGSVSRGYVDASGSKLIAAFHYPGVVAHVGTVALDGGAVERLVDIKGPTLYSVTSLAYDPASDTIFYTSDNTAYRDLRAIDSGKKHSRMLLRDARIGDLAFSPSDRALWGIRHLNGIATLVRIPEPWDRWSQVRSWPYGETVHDLDVSPDGSLISVSVGEIDGRHLLRVYAVEELLAGEARPVAELDFGNTIPSNFVFSPDGRHLVGSAYYTGVSNIFRFDVATQALEALTNSETGLFRPIPQADGSLIVFRYTGEGFVPARIEAPVKLEDLNAITFLGRKIAQDHPVVQQWNVGSPADVDLQSRIVYEGPYRSRRIGLESIIPVVEGYKDFAAYGFSLALSDALAFNRIEMTASYTPNSSLPSDERLHLEFDYKHKSWSTGFKWNDADFYDLFGPTKRSRKGYVVHAGFDRSLIYDTPRTLELSIGAAHYGDLEQLPSYQNVLATFDELTELGVQLTYSNRAFSLGAVDHEKGVRAEALVGAGYVDGETIPSILGSFDYGFALPIGNSSIWWRNSVGATFGELDDPFASFFLGGFGSNYVDFRSAKRYREWYSFPGAELNAIGGRNFAKSMLEWNLPPLRFRRVGTPAFFVSWARPSIFVGGIETNLDSSSAERRLSNVGAQVDLRMTVLSRLNLTVSFGYARAHESGLPATDEWMASLKILD